MKDFCSSFSCPRLLERCAHFVWVVYCCIRNLPQTLGLKTKNSYDLGWAQKFGSSLVGWLSLYSGCWQGLKSEGWTGAGGPAFKKTHRLGNWEEAIWHFTETSVPHSVGLSISCSQWTLPQWVMRERNGGRNHHVFYNLVLEVTRHHFCCILLVM